MALTLEVMRAAHQKLAEKVYELIPVDRGYANRTLYINLSDNRIEEKPVTEQMKQLFTGGKGFALWLLWQAVSGETRWDDPQNELILAGGPIGGITSYPGTGKTTAVTVSPQTGSIIDSNGGGYFGPYLKFAGWDAIEIQGKAQKDVIIYIDGDEGRISIEEAPLEALDAHIISEQLTRMYAKDERDQRNVTVVCAGQAAEHVIYTGLNLSWYDPSRKAVRIKQAARGGCGRVFRDKGLKAIVVRYSGLNARRNNPADFKKVMAAGKRINKEISDLDSQQNNMRVLGTAHLVEIMNHFDLLPVHNYQFGASEDIAGIDTPVWRELFGEGRQDGCWVGCTLNCSHGVDHFHLKTGPYKDEIVLVDGPEYETVAGLGSNIGNFNAEILLELNFYADTYGIDTISLANSIAFVKECYAIGVLNKERTGGLDLTWENGDDTLELLHQMARGEGFGVIVGMGTRWMKHYFIEEYGADPGFMHDIAMEVKGLEFSEYVTKESLAQQGGFALALKGAQHDEAWLIFMDQVNKQLPTFEDKAEALFYYPMWRTWFSLHGLCKLPWNDITPSDNDESIDPAKVPEHVENYCWLHEGVTGEAVTPDDLILHSERVYQLQRIFNLKMGFGTREHDYPPYRAVGPVTAVEYESRQERYDKQLQEEAGMDPSGMSTDEKVAAVRKLREAAYETLVNAVYKRRGWTDDGVPLLETLKRLKIDLPELVEMVKSHQ